MNFIARFPGQRYGILQRRTQGRSISRLLRLTTNDSRYGPNIARGISKTAPRWFGRRLRASKGETLDAQRLYEQAIRLARENGFVQNEGLAHELAAQYCLAHGLETAGTPISAMRGTVMTVGAPTEK